MTVFVQRPTFQDRTKTFPFCGPSIYAHALGHSNDARIGRQKMSHCLTVQATHTFPHKKTNSFYPDLP